jgi:hypothetical protein
LDDDWFCGGCFYQNSTTDFDFISDLFEIRTQFNIIIKDKLMDSLLLNDCNNIAPWLILILFKTL